MVALILVTKEVQFFHIVKFDGGSRLNSISFSFILKYSFETFFQLCVIMMRGR